jgi:hypothetical protein
MHTAELDKLLNLPVMQAAHNRFDTVDGVADTLEPAAQVVCAMQNVLPAWLWNSVAPHAMQAATLLSPEYCPARQSRQRSGVLLVLSLSYCPGTHWTLTEQNGWPMRSWYLPFGQSGQEAEFDMLENFPTEHASQMRFEVLLGLVPTFEPAAQVVCAMQNVLPSSLWNSAAPHAMQAGALLSPEYCPGGHSRQRSGVLMVLLLSYWPGTQAIFTSQNG